ncbi:J domain-containing protein [Halomicroarcula sp. S1AR25-4]|uniref:J domain-containing protein n=1 Tax=Haloarcula sp. S1AR25-4 TaxID=2950538 RepID=UPI002874D38F|nr:J domain-containing protein [Halomicroarcula sp. S1AR25-4]MDS0277368.1 J domain-containing protein [Halomicroarcula sp. S1AR25-4]
MVERSGYTVYFSTDLRERVSNWADNSTSSQADIIDKALEDFFDRHTITEDGTIVIDDANSRNTGQSAAEQEVLLQKILANQEEMLSSINVSSEKNGADIFSDGRDSDEVSSDRDDEAKGSVPDTVQISDIEEQIEAVAGDYHHDECIDPDDVATLDVRDSDVVKQTPRHLIPALVGMINHEVEQRVAISWMDWDEIEDLIVGSLGMSVSTARDYRKQMIREGVIRPHPSHDDRIVGDDATDDIRVAAASATSDHSVYGINDIKSPDRYPDEVAEYIEPYVMEWEETGYCVEDSEYVHELWNLATDACERIAISETTTRSKNRVMSSEERIHGATKVVSLLAHLLEEECGVDSNRLVEMAVNARDVNSPEEYHEWTAEWAKFVYDFDAEITGEESGGELGKDEAREVLGVDEDATGDEIREAYEEYVLDNHPDADGSDEEIDTDEFHRVLEAKRVLTG